MDKNLRRKKIQEALATPPITSGVKLTIRNKSRDFNVYQIPLDCLIYNPYNGRFKSKFKTYEALYGRKLDAEDYRCPNIAKSSPGSQMKQRTN